ncbi:hypothetical protein [Sphingomonas sp. 28-63-12]|uniref:hypothetical protein n=1 Tax=Sphingomonas sp. 28-63-12 TaxID=1970434 RepID=UPI000BC6FA48|nr:MAG: hypothetical protein B7Y47_06420 [Sphingomonas sp. 28-63-12]
MAGFRVFLVAIFLTILLYTVAIAADHGMGLIPIFFSAIAAMTWQGQFNVDFSCFLLLSGLWVAWRHNFSALGLLLAPIASFGGALFLSAYLLILSFQLRGDMAALMMGSKRVAALRG